MKTATAKDLKQRTASILDEVGRGQKILITRRGKSVAALVPVARVESEGFEPIGFGLWRDRKDMRSVKRWVNRVRAPRHEG